MSGNGKEPKGKEQKLTPIEQMRILYETTHAAFRITEALYDNDDLTHLGVTWRLGSIVGILAMAQSEIETAIILMEDEDVPEMPNKDGN